MLIRVVLVLARLGWLNHEIRGALELCGDVDYDYDNDNDNDEEEADAVNNRNLGTPLRSGRSKVAGFAAFSGSNVGDE